MTDRGPTRLGVLVSGRGSNLNAVLEACACGELDGVAPTVVISNRAGVTALDVAARHGVRCLTLERTSVGTASERDAASGRALAEAGAKLVGLAGYDQLLRPSYFEAFAGRTINIHPSLLPRHGGKGMMGLAVHRSVIAAGDAVSGVTIHEVTPELDAGSPLLQVEVPVRPDDDAERLAERVLTVEHRSLVEVLGRLAGAGSDREGSVMTREPAHSRSNRS
jgi:phosphoribosylglycinamide formyltransferase-1